MKHLVKFSKLYSPLGGLGRTTEQAKSWFLLRCWDSPRKHQNFGLERSIVILLSTLGPNPLVHQILFSSPHHMGPPSETLSLFAYIWISASVPPNMKSYTPIPIPCFVFFKEHRLKGQCNFCSLFPPWKLIREWFFLSLLSTSLRSNSIGPQGAKALADALKINRTLASLRYIVYAAP